MGDSAARCPAHSARTSCPTNAHPPGFFPPEHPPAAGRAAQCRQRSSPTVETACSGEVGLVPSPAEWGGAGKSEPHSLFGLGRCAVSSRPPVPWGGACGGDREEEGTSAAKPPGPLGRSIWVTAANLSLGSGPSLGWRHRTGTCMRAERDSVPSSLRPRCARDRLARRPGRRDYARPRVRSGDGDAER